MANNADPDQTAPKEQSDLGLNCLLIITGSVQIFTVTMVTEADLSEIMNELYYLHVYLLFSINSSLEVIILASCCACNTTEL